MTAPTATALSAGKVQSSVDSTSYTTPAFTPGTGLLCLAIQSCGASGSSPQVTSIIQSGITVGTWRQLASGSPLNGNRAGFLFIADCSGGTGTITVNFGALSTGGIIIPFRLDNAAPAIEQDGGGGYPANHNSVAASSGAVTDLANFAYTLAYHGLSVYFGGFIDNAVISFTSGATTLDAANHGTPASGLAVGTATTGAAANLHTAGAGGQAYVGGYEFRPASALKLYLREIGAPLLGTMPSAAASAFLTSIYSTIHVTGSGAPGWLVLSPTPGSSQKSASLSTNAVTTAQNGWLRRFMSDQLDAQSLSGAMFLGLGVSQADGQSHFVPTVYVWIYRPATGAIVQLLATFRVFEPATTQLSVVVGSSDGGTPVSVQAGDLLLMEIYRDQMAQGAAVSYANTIYYDGATIESDTDEAAYIGFENAPLFLQPSPVLPNKRQNRIYRSVPGH